MQQRPELTTLIDAVAGFLASEVRPMVEDRAVRFRLLIAANLLQQVSAELRGDDALRGDELASLTTLLGATDVPRPASSDERRARIASLDRNLVATIRASDTDQARLGDIRRHLLTTLRQTLEATDPKFDLSMDLE